MTKTRPTSCAVCGAALVVREFGTVRQTCGDRCRKRRSQARSREATTYAWDLLRRQTDAIIAQDAEALAQVVADAEAHFAPARQGAA